MTVSYYLKFLLLALSVLSLNSQADVVVRAAEITAFGVFDGYDKRFERPYDDKGPATDSLEYVRFTNFTQDIPGKIGINFGIEYVVHSIPEGDPILVTGVILYPAAGLVSPTGRTYQSSQEKLSIKLGEKSFYGFGFDHQWEIVPGTWVIQIRRNGALLAKKSFTIYRP